MIRPISSRFAGASYQLGLVIRYGDVRQFDSEPLKPLLEQLFPRRRALALMPGASNCDLAAAKAMLIPASIELNKVAPIISSLVKTRSLWISELQKARARRSFESVAVRLRLRLARGTQRDLEQATRARSLATLVTTASRRTWARAGSSHWPSEIVTRF